MEDASLEDFLADAERDEGDGSTGGNGSTNGADSIDREAPTDGDGPTDGNSPSGAASGGADAAASGSPAPDPTHSTYCWTPEGADCADCGATVEARWRDDGRFVCAGCKAW